MEQLKALDYLSLALLLWLALLSFFVFQKADHVKKLTQGTNKQNLAEIVEKLLEKQSNGEKQLSQVLVSLDNIEKRGVAYFQKSALIRFNPFEDAGGDQSFVIALLDGQDTGVVISSLHSRGGTRVYAKSVIAGKAASHQFSKEEKEAVEKAARPTKTGS